LVKTARSQKILGLDQVLANGVFVMRFATPPRKSYPSDLTDEQWSLLEPLLPTDVEGLGRPREVDFREVINAILYLNRSGCQWDMLPHDLPPKSTVYDYFAEWRDDGTWQRLLDALRIQVRVAAGREPTPSAASVDSQSVKTTARGGERGYDGAKKITGRKRHIFVDTLGLLLAVTVTAASVDDAAAVPALFAKIDPAAMPRLTKAWADSKYHNHDLYKWIKRERSEWDLEIVSRPPGAKGFLLLAKRWVAERTFSWNDRCRRHSKDYERRTDSSEAMVKVSAIGLMLRRLAPTNYASRFNYSLAA
jgi:putative transposase